MNPLLKLAGWQNPASQKVSQIKLVNLIKSINYEEGPMDLIRKEGPESGILDTCKGHGGSLDVWGEGEEKGPITPKYFTWKEKGKWCGKLKQV